MKKSIFNKKIKNPKFKAVYDEVAVQLAIGEKIAELRHKANMTQQELADQVHTSRTAIARYESGKYDRYNISTLMKIAKAFGKKLKISFL
ncbi:MAG: helix-turn-helix transcriptional regulator [Candidatus Omnitrophota bacterium]